MPVTNASRLKPVSDASQIIMNRIDLVGDREVEAGRCAMTSWGCYYIEGGFDHESAVNYSPACHGGYLHDDFPRATYEQKHVMTPQTAIRKTVS